MAYHEGQQGPAYGFVCPRCPDHPTLQVDDTRRSAANIVTRYRRCPKCRYTRVTEERPRPRARRPVPL